MKSGSASAILAGTGIALNKTTSGTVTLTGANTYTGGTNVSGGSLLANNTSGSAAGTGAVTVTNSGTLLGGNGIITGAVSMASGTNLSPGATTASGSTAVLKTGALTLSSGSNFNVDLNGTTAGTGHDQVQVTGAVTITGSNIVVNPAAGLNLNDKCFVLLNDGSDAITGTFAQGTTVTVGVDTFLINYLDNGDSGMFNNDISLTLIAIVPEPSTWVGATLALGTLGWSQRGRFRSNRIRVSEELEMTSRYL
jgi:autotransporter-associated beta strand protein